MRLLSYFLRSDRWPRAQFRGLPAPAEEQDPERRDYVTLASGLARILSRCPRSAAERELAVSVRAFRALNAQIRNRSILLPPGVLNDLSHEIALCGDRDTLQAALRCLRRQVGARRLASR